MAARQRQQIRTETQAERDKRHQDSIAYDNAMWLSILRQASNVDKLWKRCDPACRRGKRCMASAVPIPCQRLFPPPSPMSDEEIARSKADLRQALSKRLAELQEEKAGEARTAKDGVARLHRRDARS